MTIFSPHSTRAASTSRAIQHLPLATLTRTVGWKGPSTFAKYYNKPISTEGAFATAVLQ